jgi:uncharacterized protein (DUF2345 family)
VAAIEAEALRRIELVVDLVDGLLGVAIDVLAGAVKKGSGSEGTGITAIAAKGDTELQAQAGPLEIAAKNAVTIQSEKAQIDWAAAKKITLATAGGASVTIEGGNITFECPGTITVRAGTKSFAGGGSVSYGMPALPKAESHKVDRKKQISELYWSYGADLNPLQEVSRYFVDVNLHVKTVNYSIGESVTVDIFLPTSTANGEKARKLKITGTVNKNREVIFRHIFENQSLELNWKK